MKNNKNKKNGSGLYVIKLLRLPSFTTHRSSVACFFLDWRIGAKNWSKELERIL